MFKYLFHHIAVEWNVKLSHLCCYCQKHKHFGIRSGLGEGPTSRLSLHQW